MLQVNDPTNGDVVLIPISWPPSHEPVNRIDNQIEAQARQVETQEDVDAWVNKSRLDLKTFIGKEKIDICMRKYKPNPAISHRFGPDWSWGEFLEQISFWGAQYTDVDATRQPFDNWAELIGVIANNVAASRALVDTM